MKTLAVGLGIVALSLQVPAVAQQRGGGGRAQQPPGPQITVHGQTFTQRSLFERNVGGQDDMTKQFPPHKVIGNIYYVGTYSLSSFLIVTPAGRHPDQQHLRAQRADDPEVGRAARLQVRRHQDPARQPRARRPPGRRRHGEAADRRAGDGDGRGRARAQGDDAGRQAASDRPRPARRRHRLARRHHARPRTSRRATRAATPLGR